MASFSSPQPLQEQEEGERLFDGSPNGHTDIGTDSDTDTSSNEQDTRAAEQPLAHHLHYSIQPQHQQRYYVLCFLLSLTLFPAGYLLGLNESAALFNRLSPMLASLSPSPFSSLPSLALLCRSYSGMWGELLPTMMLYDIYWPTDYTRSSFVWVLDDESDADHMLGTLLAQTRWNGQRGRVDVRYEAKPAAGMLTSAWRGYGYARQQFSNMYCDHYTDAEYVGIVDSDGWPIRPPVPSDLFSLRADGQYRALLVAYNIVSPWCAGAEYLVGKPCPGEFMIRFPVMVKTRHFALMRQHIVAHRGVATFEEAYQRMLNTHGNQQYGQFNIIGTYLYHFHHDEYEWRINSCAAASCAHPNGNGWTIRYNWSDTSELARQVLSHNHPTAQLMKHTAVNTNDLGMLTKLFRFLCVSSRYTAGECRHYLDSPASPVLPPRHVHVQYRNYFTRPGGIFNEEADSDERPWFSSEAPDVAENGKRVLDETWRLYEGRWKGYKRAEATYVPYQLAYNETDGTFTAPPG